MEKRNLEGTTSRNTPMRAYHLRTIIQWVVETDKEFRVRQSMLNDCNKW
ncbi:MAG: hypothetical protein AAF636_14565 [Pseudomonadota bacterium]